ncbi:ImuA family protein [Litoreibacter janthinus]|uniref:Protein ImuA n=1 Tax=Litoreibacter janthinus TaxID=670154 RepID=A0A1I6FRR5_9RHOB|nr:hypothetical protein [Litoreibacter janthinus]SFR32487.1 protein ImuA [Litoreibacter janthinus]
MKPDLFSHFPLRQSRVHEACGAGAISFAAMAVARAESSILWIREAWRPEVLYPVGLSGFIDPAKLLVAQAKDQIDGLAVMEEALRDGAVPFVCIELGEPLSLTAGRRLQLAAKAGKTTGLCLIPEGMGSNAVETRWHCTPVFDADDSTLQRWEITKNKSGTLGVWHVRWNAASRRVHVVPSVSE